MISKFIESGHRDIRAARHFVRRQRGRHAGQGRILQGPAALGGVLLQLDRRLRRHQRRLRLGLDPSWPMAPAASSVKPKGWPGRRHARLQLADRRDRLGHRRRLRLVDRSRARRLRAAATCAFKNNWLATVRGRVGYAFDRWLPYVTGGGAFGDVNSDATSAAIRLGIETQGRLDRRRRRRIRLPRQLDAKLEYLYVDLGKFDLHLSICAATVTTSASRPTSSAPA